MSIDPIKLARTIHEEMIERRRDFHRHPEIGFNVHRTATIVADELRALGFVVKTGVNQTGVVADLVVPHAKKRIALRSDMDALPIQELSDLPYKSQEPMKAHLCGHDAHMAMLLGAAKILTSIKDELKVSVRFIFQPSEEVWPGGAPGMIEEGVLDGVDEIYGMHVWPTLQVGSYGVCRGSAMAQADAFDIAIIGQGGHAASPHAVIDPIVIGAQVIEALQTVVSRNINPDESAVLSVTQVHAGSAYNVVPEVCTVSGTVRTYDAHVQKLIVKRIKEIVEHTTKAYGAKGTIKYVEGYPVLFNHERESEKVREVALSLVSESHVDFPAKRVMFGEDFAYYLQKVKGCFIHLGCRNELKGLTHLLHDPLFDIDEECLVYGAALHVALVLKAI